MVKVLCIGHAAYDLFLYMDSFVKENQKYVVNDFIESGGGPAANAAFVLGFWGVETTFAGLVGDDFYGQTNIDDFKRVGINIESLEIREGYNTPLSIILVNKKNGSRTIINRSQAYAQMNVSKLKLAALKPDVLLFDGHEKAASLLALKTFPRAISILDAGSLRKTTEILLGKVDYPVCSASFALSYSVLPHLNTKKNQQSCLNKIYEHNKKQAIVTLGKKGLIYWEAGRVVHLPAWPVKAVDTTAAGDIFHGAFAYGILNKMPLVEALRFSSITAALAVNKKGGKTSIPSLKEVERVFFNSQSG
jgi:sulfofructose kinase